MEELIYEKKQIEEVANILNTIPFVGLDNAQKLLKIMQILNSFKPKEVPTVNTNKTNEIEVLLGEK